MEKDSEIYTKTHPSFRTMAGTDIPSAKPPIEKFLASPDPRPKEEIRYTNNEFVVIILALGVTASIIFLSLSFIWIAINIVNPMVILAMSSALIVAFSGLITIFSGYVFSRMSVRNIIRQEMSRYRNGK